MPCRNFSEERESGEDDILLREVDLEIELVDRHPVTQISVEAVGLLHQHRVRGGVAAQIGDHLVEMGSSTGLGGFDIDIFPRDANAVISGISAQQFELRVDREALALLLLGGDARVKDRTPGLLYRLPPYEFRSGHGHLLTCRAAGTRAGTHAGLEPV
jgi:hypothetical protein